MKIALASYEFPPDTGFGGIGTYTWYQARAMAQLGHEVHVVAGSLEPGIFHSEVDGVHVTRVLDPGPLRGAVDGMHAAGLGWAPNRLRTAAGAYAAVVDLLEREALDLVEFPECGGDGIMISTMLEVPTCLRFHSPAALIMEFYGAADDDVAATEFLEQIAIDQADIRMASSEFLAAEAVAKLRAPTPVHVVPNGIDLELFDAQEGSTAADHLGLPDRGDAVLVVFTGRLERRKGVHLLPQICRPLLRRYPHVHIALAGSDPDGLVEETIRPGLAVDGTDDRLHAFGHLAQPQVRALVRKADIHLLPTEWDNAPYSCLEAMASGGAMVTADVGGMGELISHERSGLLATRGDARSFVDAVSRLVEDRALRERFSSTARRDVEERYTAKARAAQTVEVWRASLAAT